MFKNYIKLAWRKIKADKLFSVLNILGLSIGLGITLLLFLFVFHETSFDTMYPKRDRIARVLLHTTDQQISETWCASPSAVGPSFQKEIPEIEKTVRFYHYAFGQPASISVNDKELIEPRFFYADESIIDVFDLKFIQGNPKTALTRPNTIIISESSAKRYFGNLNPIGKQLKLENYQDFEITGVFKDFSSNSTIDCNVVASFKSTHFAKNPSWGNASFETYVLLSKNANLTSVEKKMAKLIKKEVIDPWYTFSLQPFPKVHLYSADYSDSYTARIGNIEEVRNLSFLAVLILIIACINYMNLITARSQKRHKEIGINKTLGASTKSIVGRFYAETGLITLISVIFSLILAILAIPLFNRVTGIELDYKDLFTLPFIGSLLITWIVTTLIAGSYPALHLSQLAPNVIVKSVFKTKTSGILVRKGLVVFQFTASVILIIGVMVVYQQINFIKNRDLGFNPDKIIAVSIGAAENKTSINSLKNKLLNSSNIVGVSSAQGFPGVDVSGRDIINPITKNGHNIQTNNTDAEIVKVLNLKLLAGKTLPKNKAKGDSIVDVILNKKAVDFLGISPNEAVGKRVQLGLGDNAYIRGVVDNFNFSSLREPIGAYAFHNDNSRGLHNYLLVKFQGTHIASILEEIKDNFEEIIPNAAFQYSFLDKNLERFYTSERRMASIGLTFSILAVFIACLGLFGLAAFTAEQRSKEIGIRKVVGASVFKITKLLSLDFLTLVAISLVLAFPLAAWLMNSWLQNFAYRIELSWVVFIVAGVIAIVIAIATVSFHAIKAAMANPVKSLKTE
ncbi:ABC transporter permease [Zunongwangia pacifica]|uniref:ABC transporter permease n=1 Tax=Zunongwangia pacifica TaxID=2911062 RepID=A0A9X2CNJ6_9FLAO|nr:ABC transporter permease [Zunongwangia pacifica]MCL6216992.1 ABC transporter permease [Zunongwangia pacifica]